LCGEHVDDYINSNGLLSQWRAYGGNGGYAIVFRTKDLEEIIKLEADNFHYGHISLADVVYSDDEEKFKQELSPRLEYIANHLTEIMRRIQKQQNEPPDATESYPSFVSCTSRYKDRGFKEEQEVRIVALPTILTKEYREIAEDNYCNSRYEKERKFRDANGIPTPYIELFNSSKTHLPIDKIIVGPHKDKEARAAGLRAMLKNMDIEVTISEIPLIG